MSIFDEHPYPGATQMFDPSQRLPNTGVILPPSGSLTDTFGGTRPIQATGGGTYSAVSLGPDGQPIQTPSQPMPPMQPGQPPPGGGMTPGSMAPMNMPQWGQPGPAGWVPIGGTGGFTGQGYVWQNADGTMGEAPPNAPPYPGRTGPFQVQGPAGPSGPAPAPQTTGGRIPIPGQPGQPTTGPTNVGGQQDFGNLSDPAAWMGLVGDDAKLDAFVRQGLGPNADQGLIDYYKEKVRGQPGANPTEQAGSAKYWQDKFAADPKAHPGAAGAGGGAGGYGRGNYNLYDPNDLTTGFTTQFGGVGDLENTPGYKFARDQGLQAIDRGAAAKGTLLTGGNQKDLATFASGLASQTYSDEWNRAHQEYLDAFNIFNTNQGNLFGRNYALSGQGLNAAQGQAGAAEGIGKAAGTAYENIGNAEGAGAISQGNNWADTASTLGQLGSMASRYYL